MFLLAEVCRKPRKKNEQGDYTMKTAHEFESTHAYVIHCLESSIDRKRRIALLRYELEHPAQISPREMIDVMNYSRGDCDDRTKVRTSNNSYYIAANYKENAKAVNESIIEEILGQLVELEQVQNRLEYYLSLLNWRERDILQMRFLEGWHIIAIAKKFDVTDRTIDRIKKRAIETLVEMYEVAHFRPCDGAC